MACRRSAYLPLWSRPVLRLSFSSLPRLFARGTDSLILCGQLFERPLRIKSNHRVIGDGSLRLPIRDCGLHRRVASMRRPPRKELCEDCGEVQNVGAHESNVTPSGTRWRLAPRDSAARHGAGTRSTRRIESPVLRHSEQCCAAADGAGFQAQRSHRRIHRRITCRFPVFWAAGR